jgi:hypothetical protein
MIGRAAFWLGVTVLLTPHEPDIGLEHPSAEAIQMPIEKPSETGLREPVQFAAEFPALFVSLLRDFQSRKTELQAEIAESLRQSGRPWKRY